MNQLRGGIRDKFILPDNLGGSRLIVPEWHDLSFPFAYITKHFYIRRTDGDYEFSHAEDSEPFNTLFPPDEALGDESR